LFAAVSLSNVADGVTLAAFPLLAITLTGNAWLVSLVAAARFLPKLLFALPVGQLLDRRDRRVAVLAAQLARAAAIALVASSVAADRSSVAMLVAAALVVGTGEIVADTGMPALVRQIVERDNLELANSRLASSEIIGNYFVGPPLGGLLFAAAMSAPFFAVAAGFLAASVALAAVPGAFRPVTDAGITGGGVTQGLRWVWAHPVLHPLALTVAAIAFLANAMSAVTVILATERFGLGEVGFGLLLSVEAVSAFATSLATPWVIRRVGHTGSMTIACFCLAIASFLYGIGMAVAVAVVAAVVGGAGDPLWNIVSQTIRQRLVPDEIFGRVVGAYLFIAWSTQPLGALAGGAVAQTFGVEVVYLATAALMVPITILLVRPMLREARTALAAQMPT
jgi:MFS family permease